MTGINSAYSIEVGEIIEVLWSNGAGYSRYRIDDDDYVPHAPHKLTLIEDVHFPAEAL